MHRNINYFLQREQQKKESIRRHEIFLVNIRLQQMLQQVRKYVDEQKYQKEIKEAENI